MNINGMNRRHHGGGYTTWARRGWAALLGLLLSALLAGAAHGQRLKMGTLAPEGSPWHDALRDMAEGWKRASGGKMRVVIYAGGVAGDESDMVRKMRVGQLHAAALTVEGLSTITPIVEGLRIPMMLRSQAELDYVRDRVGPRIEAAMEEKHFILLTWADAGWIYFFTQTPVVSPEDLKPLRLFAWAGSTTHIEAWKAIGYRPVPLPATEIHTALQSGLINAFTTTPVAALSFQWFGQAKHMTDLKWAPLVGGVVMTLRAWRNFSPQIQAALRMEARKQGAKLQAKLPSLGAEAVRVMQKHGLQVHSVPSEIKRSWETQARAGYHLIIGPMIPQEIAAEVERLRDQFRASHGQ